MNKGRRWALAAVLAFALSGCSLDAAPNTATQPSGHTQTVGTSAATEATTPVVEVEPWNENEVRRLSPEPDGTVLEYIDDGLTVYLDNADTRWVENYCQQLLDAGFDAYQKMTTYHSVNGEQLEFYGRNKNGIVIRVNSEAARAPEGYIGDLDGFEKCVRIMIQDFRGTEGSAVTTQWGIDDYQHLLPDPGYSYKSAGMVTTTYNGQPTQRYTVIFQPAMNYEAFKTYAQALRDAGFVYEETVNDRPFWDQYSFCAKNAAGYMVLLNVSGSEMQYLMLYEPEMPGRGKEWNDDNDRAFLPEPDCSDYVQWNADYVDAENTVWRLAGMDYAAAKAYALAIQEKGYVFVTEETEDTAAGTYVFAAYGETIQVGDETVEKVMNIRLEFDPSLTLEDGRTYCTVTLDNG